MNRLAKDYLTSRNGESFSLTKLAVTIAVGVMCVQFIRTDSSDFSGFGIGVAAVLAILVGKYYVDEPARLINDRDK